MTDNLHQKIYRAIADKFDVYVAGLTPNAAFPQIAREQVAYPNRSFTPTTGKPYVRFNVLFGDAEPFAVGSGSDDYSGIAQISVFWPEKTHLNEALLRAGTIAS